MRVWHPGYRRGNRKPIQGEDDGGRHGDAAVLDADFGDVDAVEDGAIGFCLAEARFGEGFEGGGGTSGVCAHAGRRALERGCVEDGDGGGVR